jgi:hypothetical protein
MIFAAKFVRHEGSNHSASALTTAAQPTIAKTW